MKRSVDAAFVVEHIPASPESIDSPPSPAPSSSSSDCPPRKRSRSEMTTEERKALPKMGDKSRAFVSKALEVAKQNSDFLPRSFDLTEMQKDVELFEAMYPIMMALTQLQELLDDTYTTVGSEAYSAALTVYNYAKASGQGAGLDAVVGELKQRFARKPRQEKPQKAEA